LILRDIPNTIFRVNSYNFTARIGKKQKIPILPIPILINLVEFLQQQYILYRRVFQHGYTSHNIISHSLIYTPRRKNNFDALEEYLEKINFFRERKQRKKLQIKSLEEGLYILDADLVWGYGEEREQSFVPLPFAVGQIAPTLWLGIATNTDWHVQTPFWCA